MTTPARAMKVCIIGASGKLGQYMVQHALDRGYEVVGVCREQSVGKLDAFKGRITIIPGRTNDRAVIKKAVAGCDGVLTVLVPWGSTSTHREQFRLCSTMQIQAHGSCSRAGGTLPATARTCTRGPSRGSSACLPGLGGFFAPWISVIKWRRAGGYLRVTLGGPSCAEAASKRARARACPSGVGTWATQS